MKEEVKEEGERSNTKIKPHTKRVFCKLHTR